MPITETVLSSAFVTYTFDLSGVTAISNGLLPTGTVVVTVLSRGVNNRYSVSIYKPTIFFRLQLLQMPNMLKFHPPAEKSASFDIRSTISKIMGVCAVIDAFALEANQMLVWLHIGVKSGLIFL
jgi:hypothetical protein